MSEPAQTYYARCRGADLKACEDCRRLVRDGDEVSRFQPLIVPATDGRRCADHLPFPHRSSSL
jgi:hypothetical protein